MRSFCHHEWKIDEELWRFFWVKPTNDEFLSPNHIQHLNSSQIRLWKPQIQFEKLWNNFQKNIFLIITPNSNKELVAQRYRTGLLTRWSWVWILSGAEIFFFNYLFSKKFKVDLWFPQTYLRGAKVLDVIGRQKCIIDGFHSKKNF